jgi:hypothetical protein
MLQHQAVVLVKANSIDPRRNVYALISLYTSVECVCPSSSKPEADRGEGLHILSSMLKNVYTYCTWWKLQVLWSVPPQLKHSITLSSSRMILCN